MIRLLIMINTMFAARVPLDGRALTRSQRPSSAHRSAPKLAARRIAAKTARLERFCRRTNPGLAAFALALALLLTVTAMVRHPAAFLPERDAETGLSAEDAAAGFEGLLLP